MPADALVDTFHGFHIHANNVIDNGEGCVANADPALAFVSADAHWNNEDGVPTTHGKRLGDLPSLYVNADGSVKASVHDRSSTSRRPDRQGAGAPRRCQQLRQRPRG